LLTYSCTRRRHAGTGNHYHGGNLIDGKFRRKCNAGSAPTDAAEAQISDSQAANPQFSKISAAERHVADGQSPDRDDTYGQTAEGKRPEGDRTDGHGSNAALGNLRSPDRLFVRVAVCVTHSLCHIVFAAHSAPQNGARSRNGKQCMHRRNVDQIKRRRERDYYSKERCGEQQTFPGSTPAKPYRVVRVPHCPFPGMPAEGS
jgi:hypothetical protein